MMMIEGKNCEISKARMLVSKFLTHLMWIKWVRVIPASEMVLNLRLPN